MIWNTKNGKVQIRNTEMSYVSFGSGQKTLILLPGLSDGLTTVEGKALLLAYPYKMFFKDYTVYMFSRINDLPENYSIKDMANDQALAMNKLGIKKASVLGVSQGGMIAQYLAIDYPDLIDKLVIAVSAPNTNTTTHEVISYWIEKAKQRDHKELMINTAEKSYSDKYLNKYRKMYPIIGMVGKPKDYHRFLVNSNAILNFDCTNELCKITCPTLIIGGEKDKIVTPDASYQLHELIKDSELLMYQEYGHGAYEEASDFYKRVYDFLTR